MAEKTAVDLYRDGEVTLRLYKGIIIYEGIKPFEEVQQIALYPEDVLVVSYPRSGTTWTQEMAWLVNNNANVEMANTVDLDDRSHYLEFHYPYEEKPEIDRLPKTPPRVIKTHLTPEFFKLQLQEMNFKILLVVRNVKDVLVSYHHFLRDLGQRDNSWGKFFHFFKTNRLFYGTWFDWIAAWWPLQNDPRVLLLQYEEMKKDPASAVRQIASHCGKILSDEQVQVITEYTSLQNMKSNPVLKGGPEMKQIFAFLRKGEVGGWKDYFTEEQSDYVDEMLQKTNEKLGVKLPFQ